MVSKSDRLGPEKNAPEVKLKLKVAKGLLKANRNTKIKKSKSIKADFKQFVVFE